MTGQLVAAAAGLLSSIIAARALGPEMFGSLVLVQTAILIGERVASFQPWQALIRYAAPYTPGVHDSEFKNLIKLGLVLDTSGAVAGFGMALLILTAAGTFLHLPADVYWEAIAYATVLLTSFTGVPIFVLRRFERFKLTAIHQAVAALLRTVFLLIAVHVQNTGLSGCILAFAAAHLLGNVLLGAFAVIELRRQSIRGVLRASAWNALRSERGIVRFLASTHANSTLRMMMKEADILLVASFGGTFESGLYKIAKQFGSILGLAVEPLTQVLYPEFARLWATGQPGQFRGRFLLAGVWGAAIGLSSVAVVAISGRALLATFFGEEFAAAFPSVLIYTIASAIAVGTCAFHPAVLAIGRAGAALRTVVVATTLQLLCLMILSSQFGAVGAAGAHLIYYITWSIGTFGIISAAITTFPELSGKPCD